MANIKNYIENIRSAIFGKEVRGSLADGLDAINKETENTTFRQKHLEKTFDQLIINSGNSNAEIVDARVGENGSSFNKLGDRLDSFDSHLADITINGREHGMIADGVFDNLSIFSSLKSKYPNAKLLLPSYGDNIYYFAGSRPNLSGMKIITDSDVIIKVDANPNLKEMELATDIKINNTAHKTILEKHKNIDYEKILTNIGSAVHDIKNNEKYSLIDFTTWQNKIYNISTNDISVNGTATLSSDNVTWASEFTGNPQIIKPQTLEDGTLYECNISSNLTSDNFGFFIKLSTGKVIQIKIQTGSVLWRKFLISTTGAIETTENYTAPNGGAYGLVAGQEQNISFYYENNKRCVFMCSDLTLFSYNGEQGTITDVGFMLVNSAKNNGFVFKNGIKVNNYVYRSHKPLNIAIVGDSISYGAWNSLPPEKILPIMLQNVNGIGKVKVTNYAISGTSSVQWANTINTYDFSSFDYVLVMLGTNDQQGNVPVSSYIANLTTIANKIKADGAIPIFQVFPIFTIAEISGVTGVKTQNYINHAKYTQGLKKWCIQNNYEFGNARRNFGNNLEWYGDNIHPIEEGQISVLKSWTEVLTRVLTRN